MSWDQEELVPRASVVRKNEPTALVPPTVTKPKRETWKDKAGSSNLTMSQNKVQIYRTIKISSTQQQGNIHNGWHQIKNYQAHKETESATHLG